MHWKHDMVVIKFEPQANKSFLIQQFFKNVGEVWASSPHLRSKWNCTINENKNLRENRKNRNCLSNQEVVMRNKVSGAIAIPKASWGCAPALPNRILVVFLEELLLEKTVFSVRQKGVPPLLLPASMLQLPRCLVWICNLFHKRK